jgi:3-deoxy-D-manno-octulosonate 8-phosphate phosphatase (KDO 8-P phosphatase)
MAFFKEDLMKVKAFIFDVDGVLSTESIVIDSNGEMLRTANTKDGYAIQYAIKKGYPVAIITGGFSDAVEKRYRGLGMTDIYMASKNKVKDFEDFIAKHNLDPDTIMYMGDDLPDFEVMKRIGVPTCPANAVEQIKAISSYISDKDGGFGCVRDVIEQVLRAHSNWYESDTNIQSI